MTALFGTMDVHVAAIEWPSDWDADVDVFAANSKEALDKAIRSRIEDMLSPAVIADDVADDDPSLGDVIDFVRGPGVAVEDFDDWYSTIHDLNTSPWVTRDVIPIEIV